MFPDASDQVVEVVFPPHVEPALACLMVALLICVGLAAVMLVEWFEKPKRW